MTFPRASRVIALPAAAAATLAIAKDKGPDQDPSETSLQRRAALGKAIENGFKL